MDYDFDYEKELDPRGPDSHVVYPLVKIWHLLAFFAMVLPLTWFLNS